MSSRSRLAAAAALFLLAMSAFAVPACEVDSSTRPRAGSPEMVQLATPPVAPVG
jgi:hypothetical protein